MSELNKLRWRCRRGTLELDLMLLRYLEQCYQTADEPERQAFIALLGLEDTQLLHYLMGEARPEQAALVLLVNKICALTS